MTQDHILNKLIIYPNGSSFFLQFFFTYFPSSFDQQINDILVWEKITAFYFPSISLLLSS